MQNAVGAIPCFGGQRFFAAKVQLAVNIIFNQYYVVFSSKATRRAFSLR